MKEYALEAEYERCWQFCYNPSSSSSSICTVDATTYPNFEESSNLWCWLMNPDLSVIGLLCVAAGMPAVVCHHFGIQTTRYLHWSAMSISCLATSKLLLQITVVRHCFHTYIILVEIQFWKLALALVVAIQKNIVIVRETHSLATTVVILLIFHAKITL